MSDADFPMFMDNIVDERIVRRARELELATKGFGQHRGALGHLAIEVLEHCLRADAPSKSIGELSDAIARSRSAVGPAVKRLREHGFLEPKALVPIRP